jgi:neurotrimin
MIKVSNQLVAAPAGSDVTVQCYVEASPKAMNSWHRETGEQQFYLPNPFFFK